MAKNFDQQAFNNLIIENNIVGLTRDLITFKHGRKSPTYVNWRRIADDVYLTDKLSDFVLAYLADNNIEHESIYGIPDGGTKLATIMQYKWAKSRPDLAKGKYALAQGRKEPKEHGDPADRYFLGVPRGKTVIVEDIVTTGGSLFSGIDKLKEVGIREITVVILTDRNERRDDGQTVGEYCRNKGIAYFAMSNLLDLLPEVVEKQNADSELKKLIEEYFEKYGERKIDL